MKIFNTDIVFQEVPNEVSLALNISNCPNKCEGCHSKYLQDDIGIVLTNIYLDDLMKKYGDTVTCILFMGGDSNIEEVENWAAYAKEEYAVKIAWYTGSNPEWINPIWDYVKTGEYCKELGGLKSKTTNQRFFKKVYHYEDITHVFQS